MSTVAAFLADALADEGNDVEAMRYSRLSAERAADEDVVTQVMWRVARAKAAADPEFAREAVRLAVPTDYPDLKARALLAAGDIEAAVAQYSAKGNVAAVTRLLAEQPTSS